MQIDHQGHVTPFRPQRVGKGSPALLLKFWDPYIYRKWLELETSNLACRLITRVTNEKNAKLSQRWSGRGHVTYFRNLGTPYISREWLKLENSNLDVRFVKSEVVIT